MLDFSDVLQRALDLLRQMDEFSQSRFRLESRYHHVLVDEFQDTSRAQWELVSLLVQSWGEGLGLATQPSIFIVGDRKQSIYRFRDAEVAVLQEAGRYIEALRPAGQPATLDRAQLPRGAGAAGVRQRAVRRDVAAGRRAPTSSPTARPIDFPIDAVARRSARGPVLGIAAGGRCRRVRRGCGRTRSRGSCARRPSATARPACARSARPGDIAILFRSRTSHREFEHALELRGIPTYVYKGLGFFDADEIKDRRRR